jgi:hypothetical protein
VSARRSHRPGCRRTEAPRGDRGLIDSGGIPAPRSARPRSWASFLVAEPRLPGRTLSHARPSGPLRRDTQATESRPKRRRLHSEQGSRAIVAIHLAVAPRQRTLDVGTPHALDLPERQDMRTSRPWPGRFHCLEASVGSRASGCRSSDAPMRRGNSRRSCRSLPGSITPARPPRLSPPLSGQLGHTLSGMARAEDMADALERPVVRTNGPPARRRGSSGPRIDPRVGRADQPNLAGAAIDHSPTGSTKPTRERTRLPPYER